MSVSALNVGVTVLRVGFYGLGSIALLGHIFPASLYRPSQRINNGAIFDFTQRVVQAYKIKKEVILIEDSRFTYSGNNALPGSAVLRVPKGVSLTRETEAKIKSDLAQISLNSGLITLIIPMVLAIAARYLLIDRFPAGATLAELGIGSVAALVSDYGFQYAAWTMR